MKWLNWIILVLGIWVLISPWVLDFSGLTSAMWNNAIAGVLIAIFALWALFGGGSSTPTVS